jgi:RimK family alpha-L-glutamate ligase
MKLALVAFSDTHAFRNIIREEMIDRGHQCDLLYFPVLPINENLIERTFKTLSQYDVVHFVLGFNMEFTKTLQQRLVEEGVACPNQRTSITNLNDKIVQMAAFAENGVPIAPSARLMNPDRDEVGALLGFPFVLKEPVGSKGEKVTLCTQDNFDEVVKKNKEYLGQKFINYTADYRVHVAGNNAFCIYERIAPAGDFRANVSLGGAMKQVTDPKLLVRLSELALAAAAALSVDYGGIDIICDQAGNLLVLEFNSNPGSIDVTKVTGTSFQKPIVDYYESLVKQKE